MSTKKREKINQRTKLLDLKQQPGMYRTAEGVFFTFDGKRYFADKWTDHEPLNCVRWLPQVGYYVTDRKRDFGGCGKDAVKLEVGVPFAGWISEAYINEAPGYEHDRPYVQFEFDRKYYGGDYSRTGEFAYVPSSLCDELGHEAAFTAQTGLDSVHLIHYSPDELYTASGDLYEPTAA